MLIQTCQVFSMEKQEYILPNTCYFVILHMNKQLQTNNLFTKKAPLQLRRKCLVFPQCNLPLKIITKNWFALVLQCNLLWGTFWIFFLLDLLIYSSFQKKLTTVPSHNVCFPVIFVFFPIAVALLGVAQFSGRRVEFCNH